MRVLFPGIEDHPVLRELEVRGGGSRKSNKEGQEKVKVRFKIDIRGKQERRFVLYTSSAVSSMSGKKKQRCRTERHLSFHPLL